MATRRKVDKKKPAKKLPATKKPVKKKPAKKKPVKNKQVKKTSLVSPFFGLHPAFAAGARKPVPVDSSGRGRWLDAGRMNDHRFYHKSILLKDGKVMCIGGQGPEHLLETAEIWDVSTGQWTRVASMSRARVAHSIALLKSGRILAAGGVFEKGAEQWDPDTGKWTPLKEMPHQLWSHGDCPLADGRLILFGGYRHYDSRKQIPLDSTLVFNPRGGGWSPTTRLPQPVGNPSCTLLLNGQILVAAGWDLSDSGLPRFSRHAVIFNPRTERFKATGIMREPRSLHTATLLADGRVLVTGGENKKGVLRAAEMLDPKTGRWRKLVPMGERRRCHSATLMLDGRVLVGGGENQRGSLSTAEIFDPGQKSWQPVQPLRRPRGCHTAVLLPDGRVLIAGGRRSPAKESALGDAVIWQP